MRARQRGAIGALGVGASTGLAPDVYPVSARQPAAAALELRVAQRTRELEAAHRQAEKLSYSIAHDLRAPLRAISGYARTLRDEMGPQLPADANALIRRIGVSAARMGRLLDALLGAGQLSSHALQASLVNLDEIVADALRRMRAQLAGRRVEFKHEALGEIIADPSLIRLALTNLLSNAIKFSRERDPARIEIGRTTMERETVYYVRDNGAGFDMRYANKLFRMYQRLHAHSRFEGDGTGLASVHEIVHRHGGRVWAESSEGSGATFYFTLGK
ncbi:MAG: hypothetical protein IT531_02865 [Burkholderiales bacterium]|nr:hypothetical protein [Burkholderiales bacterium]